jgi:hypothetical protein
MNKLIFLVTLLIFISLISCDKEDDLGGSHNTGKNCISCHKKFTLAGSVYQKGTSSPFPGATISVYSQPGGTGNLLATLISDNSGNFYTEKSINFSPGVYLSIKGASGNMVNKNPAVTSGACNSCHGASVAKISVE